VGEVRAALAVAGFSGGYNGLLAADEEPRSRMGNKGRKAADGGGAGVGRKWGEHEVATAAAAPRFSSTVLLIFYAKSNHLLVAKSDF
jgi:survival of motor neuron protein-interacting protein 1